MSQGERLLADRERGDPQHLAHAQLRARRDVVVGHGTEALEVGLLVFARASRLEGEEDERRREEAGVVPQVQLAVGELGMDGVVEQQPPFLRIPLAQRLVHGLGLRVVAPHT
jgi:hypothetical protein